SGVVEDFGRYHYELEQTLNEFLEWSEVDNVEGFRRKGGTYGGFAKHFGKAVSISSRRAGQN
ncbi:hypothetical protein A2U01_0055831, partial [Trifolium medium]|nr:hypothetical protein [Trifolium medium]